VRHVALREFLATVGTKGFIFGVLFTPLMVGVLILVMPILLDRKPPKIDGEIAVLDPTGEVRGGIERYLAPAAIAERRGELKRRVEQEVPAGLRGLAGGTGPAQQALDAALGEIPHLSVSALAPSADLRQEKDRLRSAAANGGGPLALVVVAADAVRPATAEGTFGAYELFVREKLDDRIVDEVQAGIERSIVDARIEASGLARARIEALTHVGPVRPTTVTARGEREANVIAQMMLPAGFMILLFVSVFTGGQYLMATTIEEKSSRVVEVLLSAVSPMELMAGKIVGQLAVGLVVIVLYAGLGFAALVSFALLGMLDPWLLFYLVLFYLIAYFIVGSLMAAIGAAVNEPSEAQSLLMPVLLVMMLPWMLWMPISRDPNSTFATAASFLPPINTFVMLLRMTSSTPPPSWQVWVSIGIGVASAYAALWCAAKVFRIGLLLHGKPPSLGTLIRWVRMS
jgi:ABC-type Na+ efflux pump permease subunit